MRTLFLISSILFLSYSSFGQNLIQNGSFEEGARYWNTWAPTGSSKATAQEISASHSTYGINPTPSGIRFVEVDYETNFQQKIKVIKGATYQVRFALARRIHSGERVFRVQINNKEVFNKIVNSSTFGANFKYQTFDYTADSDEVTIGFHITASNPGTTLGVMMDDVSISKTQDPKPVLAETILIQGVVSNKKTGHPIRARLDYLWADGSGGYVWSDSITGRYKIISFSSDQITFSASPKGYFKFNLEQKLSVDATKQDINLALVPIEVGSSVTLQNLFFERAKAILKPGSEATLQQLLQVLEGNPSLEIKLVGHTDNTGTLADNVTLSVNRAKAVRQFLMQHGIAENRLQFAGKGPHQPVVDNQDPKLRPLNRRVEIEILKL